MAKKSIPRNTFPGWEQLSIVEAPDPKRGDRRQGSDRERESKALKKSEDAMETKRRKGRGAGAPAGDRTESRARSATESAGAASAADTAVAPEGPPLEEALARLEAIVRELEAGNIDLDRSLALFEEGVALSRQAAKRLSEAEAKITKLVRSLDGEFRTEPFAVEGEEA